jgi:hypothetical protein
MVVVSPWTFCLLVLCDGETASAVPEGNKAPAAAAQQTGNPVLWLAF